MSKINADTEKLTLDELKEILRLFFNEGFKAGKKHKPINEIPMGSSIVRPSNEFDKTFKKWIEDK